MKYLLNHNSFTIGSVAIIIAAIFWSLDGTIIRPNFYEFPAINIVFIEHLLWAILLSPFIFCWWKRLSWISKTTFGSLIWVSVFWGLLWTLMITEAYFAAFRGETTLSTVIILQKLQPVFALGLAAILLKEKLSKKFYILAVISIFSWYMIAYWSLGTSIFDISLWNNAALYAFLAAFAFGSSTVFGKNLVSELGFRLSTALRFICFSLAIIRTDSIYELSWSFDALLLWSENYTCFKGYYIWTCLASLMSIFWLVF